VARRANRIEELQIGEDEPPADLPPPAGQIESAP